MALMTVAGPLAQSPPAKTPGIFGTAVLPLVTSVPHSTGDDAFREVAGFHILADGDDDGVAGDGYLRELCVYGSRAAVLADFTHHLRLGPKRRDLAVFVVVDAGGGIQREKSRPPRRWLPPPRRPAPSYRARGACRRPSPFRRPGGRRRARHPWPHCRRRPPRLFCP